MTTSINWPGTVPHQPLRQPWDVGRLHEPNLATQMNAGTTRQRRRFSLNVSNVSMAIVMNSTQLAAFFTFYKTTLSNGSQRFNMQVYTGAAYASKVCSFDPQRPPQLAEHAFQQTRVSFALLVEDFY